MKKYYTHDEMIKIIEEGFKTFSLELEDKNLEFALRNSLRSDLFHLRLLVNDLYERYGINKFVFRKRSVPHSILSESLAFADETRHIGWESRVIADLEKKVCYIQWISTSQPTILLWVWSAFFVLSLSPCLWIWKNVKYVL